jgi:uncharacterized protein YjbJ (UPF0337 family)
MGGRRTKPYSGPERRASARALNFNAGIRMNTTKLKGNWNVAKGKLKQKYGSLTDQDLTYLEGREDEMLGRIQQKTGASRDELDRYLRDECNC